MLHELDADLFRKCYQAARKIRVRRNHELFLQGDDSNWIFAVVSGGVLLYRTSSDALEIGVEYAGVGAVCGLADAFSSRSYSVSARSTTDCLLLRIASKTVRALVFEHPSLIMQLNWYLASRINHSVARTDSLTGESVERRLLLLLKYLIDDGRARGRVRLALSQGDLAIMLGASRQRTNIALNALARREIIALSRNAVVVHRSQLQACGTCQAV